MSPDDLIYENLVDVILAQYLIDGRTPSASFLAWYLENVLRLDDVTATHAICDGPGDRGIDGIYVDDDASEVIFIQAKLRQSTSGPIGDKAVRDFAGSVAQFDSPEKVAAAIANSPDSELGQLLVRSELEQHLSEGYEIKRLFVTNSLVNEQGEAAAGALGVEVEDRETIADRYVEITSPTGVSGDATFDVSDTGFIEFNAGGKARLYLIIAKADDLLALDGLADGTLFAQNVRLNLGSTKVNKEIAQTVSKPEEHILFPMYHNGITIICKSVVPDMDNGTLTLQNYVVVNGAQSLSILYRSRKVVTGDLRLVVKVVEVKQDGQLSTDITLFSNNQNAIKPRDLRSTHILQTRLRAEFGKIAFEGFTYSVKRGEVEEGTSISNEEAGRLLLAFDVCEPWSCHQIYKVFDEKYSEVFGRPAVNAWRIILLKKVMDIVEASLQHIQNVPIERYRLTRYFILFVISKIIEDDGVAKAWVSRPDELLKDSATCAAFLAAVRSISARLCVDLRFELGRTDPVPDYKAVLKSPNGVHGLEDKIRRSFEQDVAREREKTIGSQLSSV